MTRIRIKFTQEIVDKKSGRVFIIIENRRVKRSRYILEHKLGRKLLKIEVAHHKNRIVDDDRPKNLVPMFTWCHNRKHHKGQVPWCKGIKLSEETRKKLSNSRMGKIPWNKGIPRSEETKRKISLTKRRKYDRS